MSTNDDELWQGYDESGEPTQPLTKDECRSGVLHGASHVWFWRKQGDAVELLLQRRGPNKLTWPDHFDISAAGHIDAGETPAQAALRETEEEVGLKLKKSDLKLVAVHRSNNFGSGGIIENEFRWVYLVEAKPEHVLVVDGDETVGLQWHTLDEVKRIIAGETDDKIVPQGDAYFANLFAWL